MAPWQFPGSPHRSLMKFCLGRTPSAPKRKDLGVTHRADHSLLSQESWACNDSVCVPPARYEAANSRSGILSSGSGAVVVVQRASRPLPYWHDCLLNSCCAQSRLGTSVECQQLWVTNVRCE